MRYFEMFEQYAASFIPSSNSRSENLSPPSCKSRRFDKTFRTKRRPQNVLLTLRNRETYAPKRPSEEFAMTRQFYASIVPSDTISPVEMPPCFLRKFSPDGRYLVAFLSHHPAALEIFHYQGAQAVGNMLAGRLGEMPARKKGPNVTGSSGLSGTEAGVPYHLTHTSPNIPLTEGFQDITGEKNGSSIDHENFMFRNVFNTLFRRLFTVTVATGPQVLNRECSLFTPDSEFVIVASSLPTQDEHSPQMFQVYRNNESLPLAQPLEDYCLYSVRLSDGHLADKQWLKCDKIYLSHNQGMYLYDRTLAILSVQHQTVYIYYLDKDGTFAHVRDVGRFLDETDALLWNSSLAPTYDSSPFGPQNQQLEPMAETHLLNSLKHRFLAALYRQAMRAVEEHKDYFPLRNFYRHWDFFRWLRIWKMQLLDTDTLLLRYASEEVVQRKVDSDSQNSYFVIYDMRTTQVLGVFENVSDDLLWLYENFADFFRNIPSSATKFPCSLSSCYYAARLHERLKDTIVNAKNGGHVEATRRLLNVLPISAQSFATSPYLDPSLFSYDEKWISVMERPKAFSGDYPIKFFGRDSGLLKFQLNCSWPSSLSRPGANANGAAGVPKHLVAFIFHPTDPLIISVQRHPIREYVVNLHLRSPNAWLR